MMSNPLKRHMTFAVAGFFLFLGSTANSAPIGKVDVCHKPGERSQKILNIYPDALAGHVGHGDYVVEPEVCDGLDSDCENPPVADNDVDCSDGIACTVDSCAGAPGCFNVPDDSLCDSGPPNTTGACSIDDGGCVYTAIPFCGDGIVNQASEQCDDGNTNDGDGCSAICQIEVAVSCPCGGDAPDGIFAQAVSLYTAITFESSTGMSDIPPWDTCTTTSQSGGVQAFAFDQGTGPFGQEPISIELDSSVNGPNAISFNCSATLDNNGLVSSDSVTNFGAAEHEACNALVLSLCASP